MCVKNLFIIFLSLLLVSCKEKQTDSILDYFSVTHLLKHQVLEISEESDYLLNPEAILIVENILVLYEYQQFKFLVIDPGQKKVLKSWGTSGNGPGEIVGIMDFYNHYTGRGINAWDAMLRRLYHCSYESLKDSTEVKFQEIIGNTSNKLFDKFFPNVLQMNDSMFLCLGGSSNKRFELINIRNNQTYETGEYPPMEQETNVMQGIRDIAYNGLIRFNPKENKVAFLSLESEMFEIFEVKESGLELVYGSYTSIPQYQQVSTGGGITAKLVDPAGFKGRNYWISTNDEYIYILYAKKMPDEDTSSKRFSPNSANDLLVFNWKGKPVKHYQLDCAVNSIAVTSDSKRIYGISTDNEEPVMIFWDCPFEIE